MTEMLRPGMHQAEIIAGIVATAGITGRKIAAATIDTNLIEEKARLAGLFCGVV